MSTSSSSAKSATGGGGTDMTPLNKVTYRATKLWLEVVEAFRLGVHLGKHRSLFFRQYDQCFVAQDAVTWFHLELQQKFDTSITRQQTVHLLQKMFKAGVFFDVRNQSSVVKPNDPLTTVIKETDFKDNKRLYKLVEHNHDTATSECKPGPSDSKPNYEVVCKPLSQAQINEIWENTFIERFVQVVGYDVFTSFLKPGTIHGDRIRLNMTEISDNLPVWVMDAMRCITDEEARAQYRHAKYPNFENEVFGLIRDYFKTFKDKAPLLTFELHDAFITIFIRAAIFNGSNLATSSSKPGDKGRRVLAPLRHRHVQEKYPFSASDSTENLLLDMLTPEKDKKVQASHPKQKRMNPRRILGASFPVNSPVIENSPNIEPMEEKSYDVSRYRKIVTTATVHPTTISKTSISAPAEEDEDPVFLETAFTSERSPITRVISKAEIDCSLGALRKSSTLSLGQGHSSSTVDFAYENPLLELSPADLVNHPKYSRILKAMELTSNISSKTSCEMNNGEAAGNSIPVPISGRIVDELAGSMEHTLRLASKPPLPMRQRPYRSQSATNLSSHAFQAPRLPSDAPRTRVSVDMGVDPEFPKFILNKYADSPSKSARKTMEMLVGGKSNLRMSVMSSEGKEFAILSFRLLTLLLPAQNRRYLHLLLQFMAKMADRDKLMLDVGNTTRGIVINEFARAILGCEVEREYDQYLAHQIVSFLMDNNQEVFNVVKEGLLKKTVEDQITEQQIQKIPMDATTKGKSAGEDKENRTVDPPRSTCRQISLDEYENQRLLGTTAPALRELLTACASLADEKERKHQLKKFRKEYPHIYVEKYGEGDGAWMGSSTEIEATGAPTPEPQKKPVRKILGVHF